LSRIDLKSSGLTSKAEQRSPLGIPEQGQGGCFPQQEKRQASSAPAREQKARNKNHLAEHQFPQAGKGPRRPKEKGYYH
jgi:hypothetical protein